MKDSNNKWLFYNNKLRYKVVIHNLEISNLFVKNDYINPEQRKFKLGSVPVPGEVLCYTEGFLKSIEIREDVDFNNVFAILNERCKEKHFDILEISNYSIKSIPEIYFGQVYFDQILISNLSRLKLIHKNAFIGFANHIKIFWIKETPKLLATSGSENNLNEFINQLINCEIIRLPSLEKVFKGFNLTKLKEIKISGFDSQTKIQIIDEDSFYDCNQINFITFEYNEIKLIKKNAFRLKSQNNKKVNIYFLNNKLNRFFENDWFSDNRPIELFLCENEMNYLDE